VRPRRSPSASSGPLNANVSCLMSKVLPGYGAAITALEPVLHNLPPRVIAIDGRNGIGKTTFGRYLAWRFNSTLIETDLFTESGSVISGYRTAEINRIIQARLNRSRPVFLEGVAMLRLLEQLRRAADFLIYCESPAYEPDQTLGPWLDDYDRNYSPKSRANLCASLAGSDS
jgi:uridine kinase